MGACHQCFVTAPMYEVRIEGEENLVVLEAIHEFLTSKGVPYEKHAKVLRVGESDMKDFYDFCVDHMDVDRLQYRMDSQQPWQPLRSVPAVLETNWVDAVIAEERIVSWAQPIVDRQRDLYAHEVLARFLGPDGSMMPPSEVFGAAKRRNRMYALDRMCRMTAIRNAVHLPKKVFINFIPTSIYSPEHCLQSTIALSRQLGFHPSKFVFEVVESEYVEDLAHLKRILEFYRNQGFYYALDDVGEGFSTIQLLRDIQPHYMKLDKSYVQGVAHERSKQETAVQFLHAAMEIGAASLAEGIEREEDFEWLKQNGFQLFQGYWIGKPKPIESLPLR